MILSGISFLIANFVLPPFFFVIISTLVLASFGKSLGIRNLYVKLLLYIFEYARRISNTREVSDNKFVIGDSDDDDEEEVESVARRRKPPMLGKVGRKVTRHNLISRSDNLFLVPAKPELERIESVDEADEGVHDA